MSDGIQMRRNTPNFMENMFKGAWKGAQRESKGANNKPECEKRNWLWTLLAACTDMDPKSFNNGSKMAAKWFQNGIKTAQESSLGALRRPFGNHVGLLHFFWHFLMPFWSPFSTFLAPFLEQKTMQKSRWKSMPKNIEKLYQNNAKMMSKSA